MAGIRDYMTRRAAEDQRQHEYTRKTEERIREVDETLDGLTDEAALEVTGAFRHWEPDRTPALFTEVAKPGEIPVWKQPTGAQDAYMKGNKVHFPEKTDPVYESTVDDNVWAPNVYGWELVE